MFFFWFPGVTDHNPTVTFFTRVFLFLKDAPYRVPQCTLHPSEPGVQFPTLAAWQRKIRGNYVGTAAADVTLPIIIASTRRPGAPKRKLLS